MSSKKIPLGRKPTAADEWVESRQTPPVENRVPEPPPSKVKLKRLTLDISPELHKRIKRASIEADRSMVDLIRDLLKKKFPAANEKGDD